MADDTTTPHSGRTMPEWYRDLATFMDRSWVQGTLQILNSVVPYLAIMAFMVFSRVQEWPYWITLLMVVPAALFLVRTFIIFHDCTHGSFFPSNRANKIVGYITGILTFTSYEAWRKDHLKHHATNGQLDHRGFGDVYTMTLEEYQAASRWDRLKYRVYRHPFSLFVVGPLVTFVIGNRFVGLGGSAVERRSTIIADLALVAIAAAVSIPFGFVTYLSVQMPVILFAGTMGIWLFYVQHQFDPGYWARDDKWDKYDAAMAGASHYKLPAVLRWFTGNIGVHHLHHLQPRIPNYKLQKAYLGIPEAQETESITFWASLRSVRINLWSEVLERFLSFREAARLMRDQATGTGETGTTTG